jgi:hypothetical protein
LCVNPNHLWLGTDQDNLRDRDQKGRAACGKKISNTVKLTEDLVRDIRRAWLEEGGVAKRGGGHKKNYLTYSELGRRFGLSNVQARNIVLRKSWKHV